MNLKTLPMESFRHDELDLAYFDVGGRTAPAILLIHGFASTAHVNWVHTGWVKTLEEAGYRVVALDNRGHGGSDKPHDPDLYHPPAMAGDAFALLDHLDLGPVHVMGYSMGARIVAFMMADRIERIRSAVFGGMGIGLVEGVGDWDPIAEALVADDPDAITDETGRMFRTFADQTGSDRTALAACIRTSRDNLDAGALAKMTVPVLVGVGSRDEIAGSAEELANLLPKGKALEIPRRDHMLSVGDKVFKSAVVAFLAEIEQTG